MFSFDKGQDEELVLNLSEEFMPEFNIDRVSFLQPLSRSSTIQLFLNDIDKEETCLSETESLSETEKLETEEHTRLPTLFTDIQVLPRLSDLSLETDLDKKRKQTIRRISSLDSKRGFFVDPLTGKIESSSSYEEESVEEEESLVAVEESKSSEEDEDLLILIEKDREEAEREAVLQKALKEAEVDDLQLFLETQEVPPAAVVDEINPITLLREKNFQILKVAILDYITDLVNQVVETCEYEDVQANLRQNLDKKELLTQLTEKSILFKIQQKINIFLNRKVCDFYKKKKSVRIFSEGSSGSEKDKAKFEKILQKIDLLLGEERGLKANIAEKKKILEVCVERMEDSLQTEILLFKELINDTFLNENSTDKFKMVIAKCIKVMDLKRSEVMNLRLDIRNKQHTCAVLKKKLRTVDKLGEGHEISDYERLGTKIYELDKKYEEMDNNVNKMGLRSHKNLHTLTHLKESVLMMKKGLEGANKIFNKLMMKKEQLRLTFWRLSVHRANIRHKIKELSVEGGILNKPALMFDYDETLSRIELNRAKLNKTIKIKREIDKRFNRLKKRSDCPFV